MLLVQTSLPMQKAALPRGDAVSGLQSLTVSGGRGSVRICPVLLPVLQG